MPGPDPSTLRCALQCPIGILGDREGAYRSQPGLGLGSLPSPWEGQGEEHPME